MTNRKQTTLTKVIQKQIRTRIALTFVSVAVLALLVAAFEFKSSLDRVWSQVDVELNSLENFVISQKLIDNKSAISEKITSLNQSGNKFQIIWDEFAHLSSGKYRRFEWPFYWKIQYPLKQYGSQKFGQFIVRGSFLDHRDVLREFAISMLVILFFSILLFVLLYPLTNKIPKKIILDPLSNILNLLREGPALKSDENLHSIAEIREVQEKIITLIDDVKKASEQVARGELAVQVAHDLRFPVDDSLATIAALKGQVPEYERAKLEKIALRIGNICNGLLAHHRGEGRKDFCFISETIQSFVDEQNRKQASVLYAAEISSSAAVTEVCVSETDINRILTNLADNSHKALDKIESPKIKLALEHSESKVVLTFIDNGEGMDAATLVTVKTKGGSHRPGGNGIGLKSIKQIVQNAGGRFDMSSEKNVGTTITIEIPVAQKSNVRIVAEKKAKKLNPDFVLVDDDFSVRERWLDEAEQLGLEGVFCASESERLSLNISKDVPNYVDVNGSSKGSGIQLAKELHRQGFEEIYLVTGDRTMWGQSFPFAKEIRNKDFPFAPDDQIKPQQSQLI
jgi:signal transduction histidine kinase